MLQTSVKFYLKIYIHCEIFAKIFRVVVAFFDLPVLFTCALFDLWMQQKEIKE